MKIICDRPKCQGELLRPGGLMFSPPEKGGAVRKLHLCVKCWYDVLQLAGMEL